MENSVRGTGSAKVADDINLEITYWNVHCGKGLFYGEGKGEIKSRDSSDIIRVTEYGVGRSQGRKTIWRGSAFYQALLQSYETKLSFLHGLVGVFETDVDEAGNVFEKVWEWK